MKAAVVEEVGKPIVVRDFPDPEIGPQDALLRVKACGICRSDWHIWQGDWGWIGLAWQPPFVMGHEYAGVIEKVGAEVRNVRVGDRVVAPFHHGCGSCRFCLTEQPQICDRQATGFGGFGEFVKINYADFNAIPLPEGVSFLAGAGIGCRFMTSYHAVADRAKVRGGEWVAVHGCGGIGLSAIQIANSMGAQVIAVDVDEGKLSMAKAEGAVATVNAKDEDAPRAIKEMTNGGADASFDALGIKDTLLNSVMGLRKGGRHVQIGLTTQAEGGQVSLPIDLMVLTEITFMGTVGNPNQHYPAMLNMIAQGKLNPERLVTRTVPIEECGPVLESMTNFGTQGFCVIDRW